MNMRHRNMPRVCAIYLEEACVPDIWHKYVYWHVCGHMHRYVYWHVRGHANKHVYRHVHGLYLSRAGTEVQVEAALESLFDKVSVGRHLRHNNMMHGDMRIWAYGRTGTQVGGRACAHAGIRARRHAGTHADRHKDE